ncbi:MAG: hypothetical protein QOH93_3670 [Chloroflexia bacterium]|jgi:hypothetical protein|nr:hypothetical protein [Chloroflexia bacterium]
MCILSQDIVRRLKHGKQGTEKGQDYPAPSQPLESYSYGVGVDLSAVPVATAVPVR